MEFPLYLSQKEKKDGKDSVFCFLNLMEQESFIIKKVLVSLTLTEVNFFA